MAAAGRTILFSSHILEEVERLADSVLVIYAGRLAASGDFRSIRRLMTDRPHTLHGPLVGRPASGRGCCWPTRPSSGRSWAAAGCRCGTSDFEAFGRALPRLARAAGISLFEVDADRRVPGERLQLPGASMIDRRAAHRGHVARRAGPPTAWLMILLASLPVVVALLVRAGGGRPTREHPRHPAHPPVMPLLALVLGHRRLGSELEDGTAVYLMVKPVPRWRILLAKMAVGAGLTVALVFPATIATSLLTDGRSALSMSETVGYALVVSAGGAAYACAFVTLSAFTGRALIVGLCYVLLWEGVLSGLLEGTRFLSIRQASLGLATALGDGRHRAPPLDAITSSMLIVVVVGAVVLGSYRLSRFEIRGGD